MTGLDAPGAVASRVGAGGGPHPFRVNVAKLARQGPRRERRSGPLGGLVVMGTSVPVGSDIEADVLLEPVQGGVMVSGSVSFAWAGACRRCLGEAHGWMRAEVRELYERHSDQTETYLLEGDQLDLEPLVRDAVLLELPQAPLCREGCEGLCPTCGAELDQGPCGCRPSDVDPRWAGLDQLREQ